jgi:hypothetical protein
LSPPSRLEIPMRPHQSQPSFIPTNANIIERNREAQATKVEGDTI